MFFYCFKNNVYNGYNFNNSARYFKYRNITDPILKNVIIIKKYNGATFKNIDNVRIRYNILNTKKIITIQRIRPTSMYA